MKNFLLSLILTWSIYTTHAQNFPELLKDITPGESNTDITELTVVGDLVFFIAPDGTNGFQLWKTDGTTAGTAVVKVINPGITGMYTYIRSMLNVNGTLFFLADDGIHGVEYWKSDGTAAGTVMIKDIAPGTADAFTDFGIDADYQAVIGDILYVSAGNSNTNDFELWRIDGTEAGTYRVKDIIPGNTGSHPELLSNAGGKLYFQIKNASGDHEIWISDGTESGTVFLKSILYVPDLSEYNNNYFTAYNGLVYFGAADENFDEELFRSDGTTAGTGLFLDLNPSDGSKPHGFHVLNNKLLFIAEDEDDNHLYTTDGTVAGTQMLQDNNGNPAVAGSATNEGELTVVGEGQIYYAGTSNGSDVLWTTDGTPAGTYKLSNAKFDFSSQGTALGDHAVVKLKRANESCYTFYETDGTVDGTTESFDCDLLLGHNELVTLGSKVIFAASSDDVGRELWSYEPTFTTGMETIASSANQVFPNPSANGIFQFGIPQAIPSATVNVYDVLGRNIFLSNGNVANNGTDVHSIDLSSFPKGIYFLESRDEQHRIVYKLIYE